MIPGTEAPNLSAELRARLKQDFDTRPDPSYLKPSDMQIGGNHYKDLPIQPAHFSEANHLSFLEGSVVKRICRYKKAKGKQDLEKAIHEIQLLIELHYGDTP